MKSTEDGDEGEDHGSPTPGTRCCPERGREPLRDFYHCDSELSVCPGISVSKKADAGAWGDGSVNTVLT